jgi:hypothetical protein
MEYGVTPEVGVETETVCDDPFRRLSVPVVKLWPWTCSEMAMLMMVNSAARATNNMMVLLKD